jgi:bacteriocin-like protein
MNILIQPQIELELTDEQLANVSGGSDRDDHGHRDWDDRGRRDWDDRGRRDWDDHGRRDWDDHGHPYHNWH